MTDEQRQRIENMACQRGYHAPDAYLLALAELDAQGELILREDEDELTQAEIEVNFRQGLHETVNGQTYPIDKLWDMVDAG